MIVQKKVTLIMHQNWIIKLLTKFIDLNFDILPGQSVPVAFSIYFLSLKYYCDKFSENF